MHNEAAKHANDKRNRRKHHRDKTMAALTVDPSRKGRANLRMGKNDIAHAKRRRVILGEDEGWMKFCD